MQTRLIKHKQIGNYLFGSGKNHEFMIIKTAHFLSLPNSVRHRHVVWRQLQS